ncbi:HAD-IA family hydrolase [Paenibacillus sp. 2RAB27]|uniref:HAD-IA family hydrolase n=1 Tax=Paenibacillus sp. 2RAB27 TaxID=3232991 RepID=UPI003F97E422
MYKHVIWDFDGTLFDTYPVMGRIFKEVLEEEGISESVDEIVKHMKISMSHAIEHYEKKYQIDRIFIEKYHKQRNETETNLSRPFEGIEEFCKYIHTTNRKNYLYTHRGESAIQLLKMHGLFDYFSDFITSQQGFERKPSPEAITYLINRHSIIHAEAIMIGDRDLDILAAKNAGIHACFFTNRDEKNINSDFMISNIQQLYSIV